VERQTRDEIVRCVFPRLREPVIELERIAPKRFDARQVDQRFDMPRIELDDPDERLTRLARRTTAQPVEVEQRFAQTEPRVGVGRIVER